MCFRSFVGTLLCVTTNTVRFYSSNTICCLFCPQISHSMCCCNFCNLMLPLTLLGAVSFLLWCYFFVVLCFDGCSVVVLSMFWSPIVLMSLFANVFFMYCSCWVLLNRICDCSPRSIGSNVIAIKYFHGTQTQLTYLWNYVVLYIFLHFENIPTILFIKYTWKHCDNFRFHFKNHVQV